VLKCLPIVDKPKSETGRSSRWGAVLGGCLVAAPVGYALGAHLPFGRSAAPTEISTPLARVGLALREDNLEASPQGWEGLRNDVGIIRRAWKAEDRQVLDLVVTLRGLESGGNTDWSAAEDSCRALKWPRCDRASLEELKKRSRP